MLPRLLKKTIKYLFLLTLPWTILPIFMGTLGGILFPIFLNSHITATTEAYLKNAKHVVQDWGVGGDVPSFHSFQDKNNRFHLTRINSNDWVQKLGFLLPREYSNINYILENDIPIDRQASLTHLMQEQKNYRTRPKEHWLFLTRLEWMDWDGWNSAFDEFLQYTYTNPKLHDPSKIAFHFAECSTASTASFLCNVWNTRSPALIHFLVEDNAPPQPEDLLLEGLTYPRPLTNLLPITVRIIELGLQSAYTGHPWQTFPTKLLQLKSLISKEGMYEQFPPYTTPETLLSRRFNEYIDRLLDAPGTILNQICELDWWMFRNINQPLHLESSATFLHEASFNLSLIVAILIDALLLRPLQWIWNEFLGTPKAGDVVFAGMEFDDQEGPSQTTEDGDDILGLKALFKKMEGEIQRMASEAGRTAAAGTGTPPETTRSGRGEGL